MMEWVQMAKGSALNKCNMYQSYGKISICSGCIVWQDEVCSPKICPELGNRLRVSSV